MRSSSCASPLPLLGNGSHVSPHNFHFVHGPCRIKEAYGITLLCASVPTPLNSALFSVRSVSYQRKAGDQFFPELLVILCYHIPVVSSIRVFRLKFWKHFSSSH
jgi:hypothetical protein